MTAQTDLPNENEPNTDGLPTDVFERLSLLASLTKLNDAEHQAEGLLFLNIAFSMCLAWSRDGTVGVERLMAAPEIRAVLPKARRGVSRASAILKRVAVLEA